MPGGLSFVVVLAVTLSACAQERAPSSKGAPEARLLPEERLALPEFGLDDYRALLHELRGTAVVNFCASWCAPCRVEAPGLAKLAGEFEGRVQFVGVNILDARRSAREFILEFDWPYPNVFDSEGEIRDLGYIGQPSRSSTIGMATRPSSGRES